MIAWYKRLVFLEICPFKTHGTKRPFVLLWLPLLLWVHMSTAQVRIAVTDATTKKPVMAAVLQLSWHADSTDAWLSDENGLIDIPLDKAVLIDSATLSCIGYQSKVWHRIRLGQLADSVLALVPMLSNLAPVMVKGKRRRLLKAQGDTLSYNVAELTLPGDKNIGAVIARIPGIQVKANGTILYNDVPIAGLTIDDDDILGSRYSMGSRSIKPSDVDTIQVLENNQRIRALAGLSPSQATYLNLRMNAKSKSKAFGAAEAGVGVPAKYQGGGNLLVLKGKLKSVSGFNANNTQPTLIESLVETNLGDNIKHNLNRYQMQPLLSLNTSAMPDVSVNWWQLNRSAGLASQQFLKRNTFVHHRLGVSAIRHITEQAQANKTIFTLPDNVFSYHEQSAQTAKQSAIAADYRFEVNKPQLFWQFNAIFRNSQLVQQGNLNDGFSKFAQALKQPEQNIQLNMLSVKRVGGFSIIRSYAAFDYQQLSDHNTMRTTPQQVATRPLFAADTLIWQQASQQPRHAVVNVDWLWSGWANIGPSVSFRRHSLHWNHVANGNESGTVLFGKARQYWDDAAAGLLMTKVWDDANSAELSLDYHHHQAKLLIEDTIGSLSSLRRYLQWSVRVKQAVGKEGEFFFQAGMRPGFKGEGPLFYRPFLTNYRRLQHDSLLFAFNTSHFAQLQYHFRKSLKLLFGNIGLYYTRHLSDGSMQARINNSINVYGIVANRLSGNVWRLNTRVSKFWFQLKTRIEGQYSFSHQVDQRVQNNSLNSWTGNEHVLTTVVEKNWSEKLTIRVSAYSKWGNLRTNAGNASAGQSTYQLAGMNGGITWSHHQWTIKTEYDMGRNVQSGVQTQSYFLLNTDISYQPEGKTWSLFANGLNMTQAKAIIQAFNSADMQQQYITQLRPLQIVAGIKWVW